jgi:hypothetical protein
MTTLTKDQILNAAIFLDGAHSAVAAMLVAMAEQSAPVQPVACFIGAKGSAFDAPETKRAYTYKEQPGNTVASKLGSACDAASKQSAGDSIDRGLGLLRELQKKGFGVFAIGAEYIAAQPAPVLDPVDLADEVIGCFHAAECEGLTEALANTTDEHLKDLVERRLMHALYAAQEAKEKSE